MKRIKLYSVLRSPNLKNHKLINSLFADPNMGILMTFGSESFQSLMQTLSKLKVPVLLDNGAFCTREEKTVLEGRNKSPLFYSLVIESPSVHHFIEPDVFGPRNLIESVEYCRGKNDNLHELLEDIDRSKAITPIQGRNYKEHLLWFHRYRKGFDRSSDYVAFGGLSGYLSQNDLERQIRTTVRLLYEEYHVRKVHLLGASSPTMASFALGLLDYVDLVSMDSTTPIQTNYRSGCIMLPPTNSEQNAVEFRGRTMVFSEVIRERLNSCSCCVCLELKSVYSKGIGTVLDEVLHCYPSTELQNAITLHNCAMYGRWIGSWSI